MKKKGFTYIEVMIAIAIFGIMLTFMLRLDSTKNQIMNLQQEKTQMTYVAERMLETYKSTLTDYESDNEDGYYVKVETNSAPITKTINGSTITFHEVKVTVKNNKTASDDNAVILQSRIMGD